MATDNPVDIVISWVDGNDPVHKRKREAFTKDVEFASCQDVGGSTRFADIGEIRYCIASINRNLDFVRKIFIITDGQDPDLGSFLSRNFKGETIPIEIVDHKTIFRGYEEFLRFKDKGSLGHQIGIECHEFPMLNNSVDFVLQPGMVFCSEPKLWFPNEVYMRVEDMVLVTEDGIEILSK